MTTENQAADIEEIGRDGATRVYRARVPAERVQGLVRAHLAERAQTIRLPGFRPGKIPLSLMEQRYGAASRTEVANRLAAQTADRIFATGGLASAIELVSGAASGDLEFRITVTHLPDLPEIDFTQLSLERRTASDADIDAAGLTVEEAREILDDHLAQQVLDYLDSVYAFAPAPALVEREYRSVVHVAGSEPDAEIGELAAELRVIAERRVRLGAVVTELARRNGIEGASGEELEDKVIEWILSRAAIRERAITVDELTEMAF